MEQFSDMPGIYTAIAYSSSALFYSYQNARRIAGPKGLVLQLARMAGSA